MEYKIGTIEQLGNLPHKFVIARKGDNLEFYASPKYVIREQKFREVLHEDIAKKFGLENVLSGGACEGDREGDDSFWGGVREKLLVGKMSTEYGATPLVVLEQFRDKLLEMYKAQFPSIKEVELIPYEIAVHNQKWKNIVD